MASIKKSALVSYSAEKMFSLVDDINAYEEFLPWCSASKEINRQPGQVKASVELSKGSVKKTFTTLNTLNEHDVIEMQLVDGPFSELHGFWYFTPLQNGKACKIELDLNFEFSNRLIGLAIGPIFTTIANNLVDAFVDRARSLYG